MPRLSDTDIEQALTSLPGWTRERETSYGSRSRRKRPIIIPTSR
jgi:hypothetical protein